MKLKTKFISKLIKKNMQALVDSLKEFFLGLESPMLQALVGGLFTWLLTAIGALDYFFALNLPIEKY